MKYTRRKIKKSVWIAVAVIAAAVCVGFIWLNSNNKNTNTNPSASASSSASSSATSSSSSSAQSGQLSDAAVTLSSYDAYKLDDLDFSFIIAKVHVKASKTLTISLDHFTTSEGIKLSEVSSYKDQLTAKSYSLDSFNIASSLSGTSDEYDAVLFIPVKDKQTDAVTVSCDFNAKNEMKFSLADANTSGAQLKKESPAAEQTFSVTAENAIEIDPEDMLEANDASYFLPSTARVFAIHVNITAKSGQSVTVSSASIATDSYGTLKTERAEVHTSRYASLLDQTITDTGDGYIFLVLIDSGHTIGTFTGTMNLQMADESQNTAVDVTIG